MSKKEILPLIPFAILVIAGLCINHWFGGFITGAGFIIILFTTIGKAQARKAAAQIDKQIADMIIQNKNHED